MDDYDAMKARKDRILDDEIARIIQSPPESDTLTRVTYVRAKLIVESVKLYGSGDSRSEEIQFRAVGRKGSYPPDGSDEDNTFARFTPSADFWMMVSNPALHGNFQPGQKFYFDISEAAE